MPEPNTVLLFRADYELCTKYLAAYAGKVVGEAVRLGYNVIDLHGVDATKEKFEAAISANDPAVVGLFGHGWWERFHGQDGEKVLDACKNDQQLAEREVLALSCRTARILGPSARDKTCVAYYGWQEDFTFWIDEDISDPLDDPYAEPFFEAGLTPIRSVLNGASIWDAYDKTIRTFNAWIAYWRTINDPMTPQILTALYWDRDNFVLLSKAGPVRRAAMSPIIVLGMVALPLILKTMGK